MAIGSAVSRTADFVQNLGANAHSKMESAGNAVATGTLMIGGAVKGAVTIAKSEVSQAPGALKDAASQRMQQLSHGLSDVGRAVAKSPLPAAISARKEASQAAKQEAADKLAHAAEQRQMLRTALGGATNPSILSQTITTKDYTNTTIDQMMDTYHDKLTNPALTGADKAFTQCTVAEMKQFVRMGETIHNAIKTWDGNLPLTTTVNGTKIPIPANLDTARAVAWYLQAKGLQDNASPTIDAAFMGGGTAKISDPGNKLYKFLGSADNVYGRYSTHFKEGRTERPTQDQSAALHAPRTSEPGFFKPILGKSQPLQNGIEDFTNKFPSNGGTMLFERLKSENGKDILFIKFESVGVPDALHGRHAKHGDVAEEKPTARQAAGRCAHHIMNWAAGRSWGAPLKGFAEDKNTGITNRGEHLKKFAGGDNFKIVEEAIENAALSKETKAELSHPHDVAGYFKAIDRVVAVTLDATAAAELTKIKTDLQAKIATRGVDMGMSREGGELDIDFS